MRGGLKGLSASLAASKGAKAKLEAKVSQWETKLDEVRAMEDEERILMAEATLRKAKAKVAENEEAIEALDRSVRSMEVVLARTVEKVKEEEVDEVVEAEVEAEEMEEGTEKEEVEVKVVVETPARGGVSQWLRGLMGSRDAGALQDLPWDPAFVAGPHLPNLDTPLLVAPESPLWTLRFLLQRLHRRLLGAGRWVWMGEGGVAHVDRPLRPGVVNGGWGWQPQLPGPGNRWGEVRTPPPSRNGGEDVRVGANQHLRPREEKGGRAPTGDSSPTASRGWAWGRLSLRGRPGPGRRPGRR